MRGHARFEDADREVKPLKQLIRHGVERIPAPFPFLIQHGFRYVRYPSVRHRKQTQRSILNRMANPEVVAQGPFQGMSVLNLAYCSEVLPKILGTYECELNDAIEVLCGSNRDVIIDIGAAEGYYAVGMALRNPDATVISFEMNPSARYYLRRLAERNGVGERIREHGICQIDSLNDALDDAHRPAVISDCEGAEDLLLDPDRVPALRRSWILVETHDGLQVGSTTLNGITERIIARFTPSHEIRVIASRDRVPSDLPPDCVLTPEETLEAMNEGRPWAQWLFLVPRS
jgi:hypothetical protein